MPARKLRLDRLVGLRFPGWDAAAVETAIVDGQIIVDGRTLANPAAQVATSAALRFEPPSVLAGTRKLGWALSRFAVVATGCTVLDVGASTGGFTRAWLSAGAARVYAVDVGHGQLLGSLRQDPSVINLERTNVADLSAVPAPVSRISVDVSYLSLSAAVEQIDGRVVEPGALLLGLVKPMFELRLATIPSDPDVLSSAVSAAVTGVGAAGWKVLDVDECPVRGNRGAVEYFLYARAGE
jgi:23S rRNA (cytidine1920-2'-O)/16S rRNA (cytidine1409-2'-O)-methyltransferase